MSNSVSSPTVVARDLSKSFYLTKDGEEIGLTRKRNRKVVEALKPLSFASQAGESIGIIGRNGSGKSTLLNLIAGNEKPTNGSVLVSAQPTLLGVGAALQPHLSAVDNVRLGLLAKGMPPSWAEEVKYEVAAWADIGEAVDRPLKTYSSGMKARLKFAVATAVKSEILLVDEALATGDASFNKRAQDRMNSFLEDAGTVFIVTHGTSTIRRYCTRAMWIHEGELIADGTAGSVTKHYNIWSEYAANRDRKKAAQYIRKMKRLFAPSKIILDSEAASALDSPRHRISAS